MAARKRRKLRLLIETISDGERVSSEEKKEKEQRQTCSELPTEILELIMSRLTLKENICASSVCKTWLSVAISVRVVNQPPWLMYFPKFGDIYEFYDPSERKIYSLEFPELSGSTVCYAKDGWLLLYKQTPCSVFFFSPSSWELIKLPEFYKISYTVAFSAAPTTSGCIVFTVEHVGAFVAISTCDPCATEWTTGYYANSSHFILNDGSTPVFCNGLFYCLGVSGLLGIFDPQARMWSIADVSPPKFPDNFIVENWWKGKFLVEHNGNVFTIYTCGNENPLIFKLNQINSVWEEVKALNGVTFFASFLSSFARADFLGRMRNSIYFSKVQFHGKHCISYSLDDNRYYPRKQPHDWEEQDPFGCIWVEPLKNLSMLRYRRPGTKIGDRAT